MNEKINLWQGNINKLKTFLDKFKRIYLSKKDKQKHKGDKTVYKNYPIKH